MSQISEPFVTISTTESFGFFETASAMRRIITANFDEPSEVPQMVQIWRADRPKPEVKQRFARFSRQFDPFR